MLFRMLFIIALFFSPFHLWATISVTPQDIKLELAPDSTYQASFNVHNTSDQPTRVSIRTTDWSLDATGQSLYAPAGTLERSCSSWLVLNPTEFTIEPHASQEIAYSIKTPSQMEGSYWSMIDVASSPIQVTDTAKGVAIQVSLTIGMQVIISNPNNSMKEAELLRVFVEESSEATQQRTIGVEVQNKNNSHLLVLGRFEIRNTNGEVVAREETDYRFLVFPQTSRIFMHTLKTALAPGAYNVLAIMDYGVDDLIAGETSFEVS